MHEKVIYVCGHPSRRSRAIARDLLRMRSEIAEAPLAATLILRSVRASAHASRRMAAGETTPMDGKVIYEKRRHVCAATSSMTRMVIYELA